jgi:hypothetical protein
VQVVARVILILELIGLRRVTYELVKVNHGIESTRVTDPGVDPLPRLLALRVGICGDKESALLQRAGLRAVSIRERIEDGHYFSPCASR